MINETKLFNYSKLGDYYRLIFVPIILTINKTTMKNSTATKGNWYEIKGKLKRKYAMLTDNDLLLEEGRQNELLGRLQIKLGKTKDEVRKIISEL